MADTRQIFSATAPHYAARPRYAPEFFQQASDALGLTYDTFMVDVACGRGELSVGFAPFVGSIVAIDQSPEMLRERIASPVNVRFFCGDLTADRGAIRQTADVVAIGRAIHHLERDQLLGFLDRWAAPGASVLVCGAGIGPRNVWQPQFRAVRRRYRISTGMKNWYGLQHFAGTPWKQGRVINVRERVRYSISDLVRVALSYGESTEMVARDRDAFERELGEAMTPFMDAEGRIVGIVLTWALEFRRE